MITRKFRRDVEKAVGKWVWLTTQLTSTSWDGDSFSDTAATLIDLSAVFNVPPGVKAIACRLQTRDSGAYGGSYVWLGPAAGQADLLAYQPGGDQLTSVSGIVPCNGDGDIYYFVEASGAVTTDIWIQIFGYMV